MSEPLRITPPDHARREEMYDLLAKVFPHSGYWNRLDYIRRQYIGRGHYDWQTSRIGWIGERIVTHWGVWDYATRVGRKGRLRTAGIGMVATHGEHRKRGLMARTIDAAIPVMRDAGYDVTILFGIPDFYHRFGYVRAWPETDHLVDVVSLPDEPPDVRARAFRPDRLSGEYDRLYNREFAECTGTAIRPTYERRPRVDGLRWTDERGELAGYVLLSASGRELVCTEAVGDPETVLRLLARRARKDGAGSIRFRYLPPDSRLARRVRRGTCRIEASYVRSGSAMIRTLNLRTSLEHVADELSRRLGDSPLSNWRGTLVVADAREKVALRIDRGSVRVDASPPRGRAKHAVRGGDEIAQLLLGTHEPAETIQGGGMRLSGDAAGLVDILFPAQHPTLAEWDRY